jgi:hypothetical protein
MMYLQYGGYQTVCPVNVSINHEMRAMFSYEPSPTREYDTVLDFFPRYLDPRLKKEKQGIIRSNHNQIRWIAQTAARDG